MRIQMLKSTIVDLKQVHEGDFVETDQKSALLLIGIGKAMPAPLPQEVVIEAEVEPQTTKPAPKRRKTNASQSGV
jgi:cell division protein FtsX